MANALARVRLALANCLAVKCNALFHRRLAPQVCKLVAQCRRKPFRANHCHPLGAQHPWHVCAQAKRRKLCKRPTTCALTA